MKLFTLCGLAVTLFSALAQSHRHTKVDLVAFDEQNCVMNGHRKMKRMRQGKCTNFDIFHSYEVEIEHRHHDDIYNKNCEVYIWDQPHCKGSQQSYGHLYKAPSICQNTTFPLHKPDDLQRGARSAKFVCVKKETKAKPLSKGSSAMATTTQLVSFITVQPSSSSKVETVTMIQPSASVTTQCTTSCTTRTTTPSAYPVPTGGSTDDDDDESDDDDDDDASTVL